MTNSAAKTDTTFSDRQYDDAYPPGVENSWWFNARSTIIAEVLHRCGAACEKLLEVGAGPGVVVKQLRDLGLDCRGVELADVSPLDAAQPFMEVGTDALQLPEETRREYTTILLLDVIEHLEQPDEFILQLKVAYPMLKKLLITVPACPELWSNYDEYYGHFRRYTLKDLHELADAIGGRVNYSSYFFRLLYLPAWLLIKMGRSRQTKLQPPNPDRLAMQGIIARLMRLDCALLPRSVPGSSAIVCVDWPD